ncbi:helix-turn-helix domain-containing protein [Kibdelosporangium phytohabitans]|uniref:helix-turn-helix domain-containing protein n=1 Tax=Kibdelosporangium phytohabitans TaxID=860235 RepID=UPI00178B0A2F|nr:helix-turn-helix transcriptional regulator [Kibdelosporangium phytohabitans]MBE1471362.1 transcriptional regulator with XRE-family HTH domain [Kibdelosporangium phytohabitans]
MAKPINPTMPKRQLGLALAKLRDQAGASREDAAEVIECSPSKISRIEHGQVGVRAAELTLLLDLYSVAGAEREALEALGRETRQRRPRTTFGKAMPEWFRRYVRLEEAASEIRTYDSELVTGLAQTPNYARALIVASPLHNPPDVDRLVEARIARQQATITAEKPCQLWAVMTEGVIRTAVGGPDVMRAQLQHILELGELPHVTIQIMPFSAGAHAASGFPFSLLRFPDEGERDAEPTDVVYLEELSSAALLDRPDDEQRQQYVTVWNHLVERALSPTDSHRLVDTVRREL